MKAVLGPELTAKGVKVPADRNQNQKAKRYKKQDIASPRVERDHGAAIHQGLGSGPWGEIRALSRRQV